MKQEDYNSFVENCPQPKEVLSVCKQLGLTINRKRKPNMKKGTWTRYVRDNFKKKRESLGKNAGFKRIMKQLSKEFKANKK